MLEGMSKRLPGARNLVLNINRSIGVIKKLEKTYSAR